MVGTAIIGSFFVVKYLEVPQRNVISALTAHHSNERNSDLLDDDPRHFCFCLLNKNFIKYIPTFMSTLYERSARIFELFS